MVKPLPMVLWSLNEIDVLKLSNPFELVEFGKVLDQMLKNNLKMLNHSITIFMDMWALLGAVAGTV